MTDRDDTVPLPLDARIILAIADMTERASANDGIVDDTDLHDVADAWTISDLDAYDPERDPFGIGLADYEEVRDALYEVAIPE